MHMGASNTSVIGRLLEEISWETAARYRQGGRGFENVLTAEVLAGLDFLPRAHFLGALLRHASGADSVRVHSAGDAEAIDISFLPGDLRINGTGETDDSFRVQPDALFISSDVYAIVEAKRIRSNAFQIEQLAREYVAAISNAGTRKPLVFLLGAAPPVKVKGSGRLTIEQAVERYLEVVLHRAGDTGYVKADLLARIPDVFCWITWDDVAACIASQAGSFRNPDPSVERSVGRLSGHVLDAITWHS